MTSKAGLERHIEKRCVSYAQEHGYESVKLDMARRSYPDRLFLGPDKKVFFVEFKRPGQKLRTHQRASHARLERLGWTVYVIDDFDSFVRLLNLNCP